MSREDGFFYEFVVRAAPDSDIRRGRERIEGAGETARRRPSGREQEVSGAAPRVFPGLGLAPLTRARTGTVVNTMLAIGGVLLLLGCANVANLLIFRAARREHEIAIRKALGASRSRLMQLQMMESWLLSLAGRCSASRWPCTSSS